MTPFNKLLDLCLDLQLTYQITRGADGYQLGLHDGHSSICFYNVENTPERIEALRQALNKAGVSFRMEVLTPREAETNINILDIGI